MNSLNETEPETARLTVDTVLLDDGDTDGRIHVLLIRRRWEPFKDHWALPGGHVDTGEDTKDAARRELEEETGLTGGREFLLVGAYAEPGRDPRGRYATFAYVTWITGLPLPTAADDATEVKWMPVDDLLAGGMPLAFDHRRIITDSLRHLFGSGAPAAPSGREACLTPDPFATAEELAMRSARGPLWRRVLAALLGARIR